MFLGEFGVVIDFWLIFKNAVFSMFYMLLIDYVVIYIWSNGVYCISLLGFVRIDLRKYEDW